MNPAPRPRATVVVPSRDRPGHLAACLDALALQREASFEVVVVDDASLDAGAVADAAADRDRVRLVRGEGAGPASARNLGASHARADVVCFTDDDCRPGPDWVGALVARIADGASAVAGPTLNGRPDDVFAATSQLITNHLAETSRHDDGPPFAPTSNLAVRAEVFDQLAFDETYPLAAGEDREWCERLARAGHDLVFEPDAWVAHHQELSARRFWRQQERYGRGAHRLRAGHGGDLRPARFYLGLLRAGFAAGPRTGSLVVVAQLATGVGVIREIAADRRRNRSAERRYGSSRD